MDQFTKVKLKNLFKRDRVFHDNILFKLHHQVNFFIILAGVVFIFGENYLNGKAIVCQKGGTYANQYCWLHGTGHIHKDLAKDITGLCAMDQDEVTANKDRQTHYYLWLPFVLLICMGLVKLPRVLWKDLGDRGQLAGMVEKKTAEKIAARFNKLKRKSQMYFMGFVFCEVLNIFATFLCFFILDQLLNGKFWTYGTDVNNYFSNRPTVNELTQNPSLEIPNPMCGLFPTEVACNFCTGSIGGGCSDRQSILCILSNNIFNQYFFLILWFWWVFLLFLSLLGLLYRAAQFCIPSFGRTVLSFKLSPIGQGHLVTNLDLKMSDYFLLGRLIRNLKGSVAEEVLRELMKMDRTGMKVELENVVTTDYDDTNKSGLCETD